MAIDGGEPEVRHGIKSPQGLQDREPDVLGVDLCLAACPQRVLDLLAEPGEIILADRSALAGLPDASDDLVASEGLDDTGTLDDDELRLLDGGEPPLAGRTLPPAPDAAPVLGNAGVQDPRVRVLAVRAEHGLSPPSLWMRLWTRCAHPVDDYLYPWDNYISVTTRCSDLASGSATSQCLCRCRGVVGRSGEREQVPDQHVGDGDDDERCEPVPVPGGRQPLPRGRLRVAYDLDQPAHRADPDQYGDDEHEGVRRPGRRYVSTDQRLRHVRATAEGT